MRIAPWLVTGLALGWSAIACAQGAKPVPRKPFDFEQYKRDQELSSRVFKRAYEIRPGRRDTPMRYLNISDDEVREIQLVAANFVPRAVVNISTVVTGCPCEEGPQCTDQVYILADNEQTTLGLQLSRIKNTWTVGAVQRWWRKYDQLLAREAKMDWPEYQDARTELAREFPSCVGQLVPAEKTASTTKPEKK